MTSTVPTPDALDALASALGDGVRRNEPLARHTSARIGGPADLLVEVRSAGELARVVRLARSHGVPWCILGGGSNVLVADAGVRGLVILNRARQVHFPAEGWVRAESGASLSPLARQCIARGWAGLEWAVNVPGTVGGAVVGNAGAFGGDVAGVLHSVALLESDGRIRQWPAAALEYGYRTSRLKGDGDRVVLVATFRLQPADRSALEAFAEQVSRRRKASQPPGASMGSIFKNPPGDYAGRLIEAAGLKGMQVGEAQISPHHANFFINRGAARAADVKALIDLARQRVEEQFGVRLELEIELVGAWDGEGRGTEG